MDTSFREEILCTYCGKIYKTASGLRKHKIMKHKDNHTVSCCNKRFVETATLEAHQRKYHSKEKLKCDHCGVFMASKKSLKRHFKTKHASTTEFKCESCGSTFKRKDELHDYERGAHAKERRFTCSKCGKKYVWRTSLHRHVSKCK